MTGRRTPPGTTGTGSDFSATLRPPQGRRGRFRRVYVVTDQPVRARSRTGWARLRAAWAVLRGVAAVVALLLGVADRLATAVVGVPPVAWMARRAGAVLAARYRRARYGPTVAGAPLEVSIIDGHTDHTRHSEYGEDDDAGPVDAGPDGKEGFGDAGSAD